MIKDNIHSTQAATRIITTSICVIVGHPVHQEIFDSGVKDFPKLHKLP